MNKPKPFPIIVVVLSVLLAGSVLFNVIQGTTPNSGPYYLTVPTSTWTFLVDQFANGTYYIVNGSNWQLLSAYSSTNGSYILNTVFGLVSGPPVRKVVLMGNFTIDHAVVVRSYTYVDATQAMIIVAPAVTVDAVQFISGCTLSEWHGGTIINNGG